MTRRNRLKKILLAFGYKAHYRENPVSTEFLDRFNMKPTRFKDILENRPDKPNLSIEEIDKFCDWLGVSINDFLVPVGQDGEDEDVRVRIHTEVIIHNRADSGNKIPDHLAQRHIFDGFTARGDGKLFKKKGPKKRALGETEN